MNASASGGLGIAGFLKHTDDSGSSGQWLKSWHKGGKGEIIVWLHTRAPIVPCMSHSFMREDEYTDKQSGKTVPTLRYPRYISPDPEVIHRNQYFRNEDGTLQIPPDLDPFLLLREWLRLADHLPLEEPIFKWNDEKNRKVVVWERGELSGLVKRGQNNFAHSIDTKIEYVYVMVNNDDIAAGPVLAREGKLLSQKISEVISFQQKQLGDVEGDPLQHPYAFLLTAQEAPSPMNIYKAHKAEPQRAPFTDEVWNQIASEDFPDPLPHGQPAEGDMAKIRADFEAVAQVELPFDAIFSEDPQERRSVMRPQASRRAPPRQSKAAEARGDVAAKPPLPVAGKPAAAPATTAKPVANQPVSQPAAGPQIRRKKVEPVAPPPAETIPCDDCKKPMLATDTKCANCGAEYEPIEDEAAAPAPAPAPVAAKPKTTTKPKPGAAAKPQSQQELPLSNEPVPIACWACSTRLDGEAICPSCGMDQGDQIPF
jgi:hypothetical protein